IYRRVSTTMQAEEGYSLEAHAPLLREYAQREGFTVVGDYHDVLSGSRSDRPGLQKLLQDAGTDRFDIVLLMDPDRLSRMEPMEWEALKAALREAGVQLATPTQGIIDLENEDDEFVADLLNLLARRERKKIGTRIARGHQWAVEQGSIRGGPLPFGYRREGKTLVPCPKTAPIYLEVIQRYLNGESMGSIAKDLTTRRVPARGKNGWYPNSVKYLLENPFYAGYLRFKGKLYRHKYPPLIDEETFWEVQRLRQRSKNTKRRPSTESVRLLAGMQDIARCAYCGEKVHLGGGSYYCTSHRRYFFRFVDSAPCLVVPSPRVDDLISQQATLILQANREEIEATLLNQAAQAEYGAKEADLTRQLQEVDVRLSRYLEQFETGLLEVEVVQARIATLQAQRQDLEQRLVYLRRRAPIEPLRKLEKVMEFISTKRDWAERWDALHPSTKRQVIRQLFSTIVVHRPPIYVECFLH